MNCTSILGNVVKSFVKPYITSPSTVLIQQTRNTFILKRRNPMPLHKKNAKPHRMKSRHFVYDVVENTNLRKRPPLEVILTQYVEGVGEKGDRLTLPPLKAYNRYLLPGLAVYVTPENVKKYEIDIEEKKKDYSSPFAPRTIDKLSRHLLIINMSFDNPWTLEPWHVKTAFRHAGYILNENCITMPERPISGPNIDIDNKEFYVTVTLNKREKAIVRCRIHHISRDPNKVLTYDPKFWLPPSELLFPEDKQVMDTLPVLYMVELDRKIAEKIKASGGKVD